MARKLKELFEKKRESRARARDLGIVIGKFPTGKTNSIVDVKGVKVGHCTLIEGTGKRKPGTGPIRSGVTVISPIDDVYHNKLIAGGFILNGAGEMSGMIQVNEWGLIETPIALTNTMSVGQVSAGVARWMSQRYEDIRAGKQVVIPVVGECDDSFLNDSAGLHIKKQHVLEAFDQLSDQAPAEGAVGAGTGMISCDFKAGIGTASRVFEIARRRFHVGVMVLCNFGEMEDLRVDGLPVGKILLPEFKQYKKRRENYGSIIVVLATDLPLNPLQIQRVCKRAALGVGRAGSYAAHGSGEIVVGFSTANVVSFDKDFNKFEIVGDSKSNDLYQAAVEATEEAILNSMTTAVEMEGIEGNFAPALPLDHLAEIYSSSKV